MSRNRHPLGLPPRCKEGGFSLAELLVVIAIVAVLASLAFPAVRAGMQVAAGSKCMGNLKQFGQAVNARAADTGDIIPAKEWVPQPDGPALGGKLWRNLLEPYLAIDPKLETCPAEPIPFAGYTKYCHFGWNPGTSTSNRPFKRVLAIKNPSKMFLMADTKYLSWQITFHDGTGGPINSEHTGGFVFRHGKNTNLLFFDGHMEARPLEGIPTITERNSAPFNAFWYGD